MIFEAIETKRSPHYHAITDEINFFNNEKIAVCEHNSYIVVFEKAIALTG